MNDKVYSYPKHAQALGDTVKPQVIKFESCDVSFTPAEGILRDYAEVEYTALSYNVSKGGGSIPFTKEEFTSYCNSAVVSRIAWVRGDASQMVFRPEDRIIVPSLIDGVLKNVGIVYETSLGITLTPSIDYTAVPVLTRDKCLEISLFLSSCKEYIGALGYIKDKTGSWDFMSMQLIDGAIVNATDKAHPAYAILASLVAPRWITSALLSPRVKYGDLNFFKGMLWELTSIS